MTKEQRKKLRGYYKFLSAQLDDLQKMRSYKSSITNFQHQMIVSEINKLTAEFPEIVGSYTYATTTWNNEKVVQIDPIVTWMQIAIARLESELEEDEEVAGITTTREFTFIRNKELRVILERDHVDMQKALIAGSWKPAIILAGSGIEAILVDVLLEKADEAKGAKGAKGGAIEKWDLVDLINVAVELQLISEGAQRLSDPVRQYRNLVHPGNEIRSKLKVGKEEATIAFNVFELVYRDLSN